MFHPDLAYEHFVDQPLNKMVRNKTNIHDSSKVRNVIMCEKINYYTYRVCLCRIIVRTDSVSNDRHRIMCSIMFGTNNFTKNRVKYN